MNKLPSCDGCNINDRGLPGGFINLPGDWILSHYRGSEGFLGWLALQPECHKMGVKDLNEKELQALGPNIKKIEIALEKYWGKWFSSDQTQRIYIVYYFESVFDERPSNFHMHIHLIPRTETMRPLLNMKSGDVNAWKIYKISKKTP